MLVFLFGQGDWLVRAKLLQRKQKSLAISHKAFSK